MSRPAVFIGDIHGRADLLTKMVTLIRSKYGSEVDIFHTGDLIDRGPDSKQVVQICIDEGIDGILGNHETWLHQYFSTGEFDNFALHNSMKGKATLESYGLEKDPMSGWSSRHVEQGLRRLVPASHRKYILGLPMWRRVVVDGEVIRLVHAGLKKSTAATWLEDAKKKYVEVDIMLKDIDSHHGTNAMVDDDHWTEGDYLLDIVCKTSPSDVLWTSNSFRNPAFYHYPDGGIQVLGHSPTPRGEPIITKQWVAVDVGCGVRRSMLAAVVFPSREVLKVNMLTGELDSEGFSEFSM